MYDTYLPPHPRFKYGTGRCKRAHHVFIPPDMPYVYRNETALEFNHDFFNEKNSFHFDRSTITRDAVGNLSMLKKNNTKK